MARIFIHRIKGTLAGTCEVYPTRRYHAVYLGRDSSCDVRFDMVADDVVSRTHAVIEVAEGGGFTISDLLSSNGTFLNGKRIERAAPLKSGDEVALGRGGPTLRIELDETADGYRWIDKENIEIEGNERLQTKQFPAIPDPIDGEAPTRTMRPLKNPKDRK